MSKDHKTAEDALVEEILAEARKKAERAIRRAKKDEDQHLLKEYMNSSKEASSNLGELLREELENKNLLTTGNKES